MLPVWRRQPIDGFLEQKRREYREDGTLRSYRYSCIRFRRFLLLNRHEGFDQLSLADIKNFACQDAHKTFSGRASCFVIIRGFLRYLGEKNYISAPNLERCLLTGTAPVEKIVDVLQISRLDGLMNSARITEKQSNSVIQRLFCWGCVWGFVRQTY